MTDLNPNPDVTDLNLDPLHLDPPWPGGLVQDVLHQVADGLPLRQDLSQGLEKQIN